MKPLSLKVSAITIVLIVSSVTIAILTLGNSAAFLLGSALAFLIEVKYLVVAAIGACFIRKVNIFVISIAIAIVYRVILHAAFQEYWQTLGGNPSFPVGVIVSTLNALLLISILHLILGSTSSEKLGKTND